MPLRLACTSRPPAHPWHRHRRLAWAAALVASPLLLAGASPAQAQSFNDLLNFQTFNQSLWGSGGALGWRYDRSIGGSWGGGASASSPVSWGFNGITGSRNGELTPAIPPLLITPEVPGYTLPGSPAYTIPAVHTPPVEATYQVTTPAVYSPAIPATYIDIPPVKSKVCVLGYCVEKEITPGYRQQTSPYIPPQLITPEVRIELTPFIPAVHTEEIHVPAGPNIIVPPIPAVFSPFVPAVIGDTRTGTSLSVQSSGAVGLRVSAEATAGAVALTLPVQANLHLPERFVKGQIVSVRGDAMIDQAARLDVRAPSFSAGVTTTINTTNELGITTCLFGAGCADGTLNPNIHVSAEIVSVDTARGATVQALGIPLLLGSGQDTPINLGGQTVAHVTLTTPQDQSGGTVQAGRSLRLESHQSVLEVTADVGGIAQFVARVPVDVLQPAITRGPATIGGTIFNVQEGVDLGMTQELEFTLDVDVTLQFDQPVTMFFRGQRMATSNQVTFDLDEGAELVFEGQVGRLVSRSYSVSPDSLLHNKTLLSIDPVLKFKAGCFNFDIEALYSYEQCAMDEIITTTDLLGIPVYDQRFALQGFNEVSFLTPVPEPAHWALLLAGLGGLGALRRRRVAG